MKKTIILSAAALSLMFVACNSSSTKNEQANSADTSTTKSAGTSQVFNLDTNKLKSGETFYQCEMHPEVLSDKPGSCPKCGMELIEMKKK